MNVTKMATVCSKVLPQWWSLADVSQQGAEFSKKSVK